MDLPFIINHGNINSTAIGQLLQRSKVKLISYPDLILCLGRGRTWYKTEEKRGSI